MTEIILYPTETLYALGVNALDRKALDELFILKGRDSKKVASWLVRDIDDIEKYAELGEVGKKIAKQFLPGPLTLVLKIKANLLNDTDNYSTTTKLKGLIPQLKVGMVSEDGTIGFRVSSDPIAQNLIKEYMEEHDSPLTCTSANISGSPVFSTPSEILQQFGPNADKITQVIDDGVRKGLATTVVRVVDEKVTILREGEISECDIKTSLQSNH